MWANAWFVKIRMQCSAVATVAATNCIWFWPEIERDGDRKRACVRGRADERGSEWPNQRKWDGTNMPIDKVPSEQLSFRLKTDYNFMQNLWDLRVRYSLLHTQIYIYFLYLLCRVICGVRRTTDLCFGLMDNPLVIPEWNMWMKDFFLLVLVVWHHFSWFVWCVSFWQKDETC